MSQAAASLKHELASIKNYLVAAQDVMKSGHMPDMAGLENRIAAICESIQQTTPDVQKECLPELNALLDHLSSCETSLRSTHEALMAEESAQ